MERKEKKMVLPIFNTEKIILNKNHASYSVDYTVYWSEKDLSDVKNYAFNLKKLEKVERKNNACFSQFKYACNEFYREHKKAFNRIRFFCKIKAHEQESLHLKEDEILQWVTLCKKNKLMSENVNEKLFAKEGAYDISMEGLTMEQLYVQLTAARYVQEEPYFVRAILSLIYDTGLGFFTAFSIATEMTTNNSGHHLIDMSKPYINRKPENLNNPHCDDLKIFSFSKVTTLARYVNSPDDDRSITKKYETVEEYKDLKSFGLHTKLSIIMGKIKDLPTGIKRSDLQDKTLEKRITG